MADKNRIKLITTGGTIAGKVAVDKQDQDMLRTGDEFSNIVKPTISYLNRKHSLDIEIDTLFLLPIFYILFSCISALPAFFSMSLCLLHPMRHSSLFLSQIKPYSSF